MATEKKIKSQAPDVPSPLGFEVLTGKLKVAVSELSQSQKITYGIIGLVLVIVLAIASSLSFPANLRFIVPLVGVPGGIILFVLVLGFYYSSSIQEWNIFGWKERTPPRQRLVPVIVGAVIVSVIIVITAMPAGVGGVIMVVVALTSYNLIRRTPYELDLSKKGLPDPREFSDAVDEENQYAEEYVDEDYYEDEEDEPYSQARGN